jgi:polyisoprenoid-binding protein YceI
VFHPIRSLFRLLILLAVVAIGFGGWYFFGGKTPAKPTLGSCATQPVAPGTIDGTWAAAPGTGVYVGYRITEVFSGDVIHKAAVGRTSGVSGTITIRAGNVVAADIVGLMRELVSDRGTRDNYIHTHGIESDRYPTSEFRLSAPISLPAALHQCDAISVSAHGTLTLHGVTRAVVVALKARWDGGTIRLVGSAPIVLSDYRIAPPHTSVVSVDSHGSLELALAFRKQ